MTKAAPETKGHGVPEVMLAEAVEKMRVAGVRRLPVVEDGSDGRLVGILTNHDVVSRLARLRKERRT